MKFTIKCNKCGSTDCEVFSECYDEYDYSYGDVKQVNTYSSHWIECNDCGNSNKNE